MDEFRRATDPRCTRCRSSRHSFSQSQRELIRSRFSFLLPLIAFARAFFSLVHSQTHSRSPPLPHVAHLFQRASELHLRASTSPIFSIPNSDEELNGDENLGR